MLTLLTIGMFATGAGAIGGVGYIVYTILTNI
jgi:hypothetical protein